MFFPELTELLRGLFKKKNKEPPLVVTSQPVRVKDIWEKRGYKKSLFSSLAIHGLIPLLLLMVFREQVQTVAGKPISLISPDLVSYLPASKKGGGGGGGDRSPLPASKGKLPKLAARQFTPPTAQIQNPNPKLTIDPSVVAPPDINIPRPDVLQFGDPFGKSGPLSSGFGSGGGIGSGSGGGVGSGVGPGVGPGFGGGFGGGVYQIRGGVSAPTLVHKVDPEYSDEARKVKFQGVVVLYAEVNQSGGVQNIKILRALGLGLDEKAIEAVKQWKFRPGLKAGKVVTVAVMIEVFFRLL